MSPQFVPSTPLLGPLTAWFVGAVTGFKSSSFSAHITYGSPGDDNHLIGQQATHVTVPY